VIAEPTSRFETSRQKKNGIFPPKILRWATIVFLAKTPVKVWVIVPDTLPMPTIAVGAAFDLSCRGGYPDRLLDQQVWNGYIVSPGTYRL